MENAFVSYDEVDGGKKEKPDSAGHGGPAEQEAISGGTEGNRVQSSKNTVGRETEGFVYFFETEDGQFVKIGFSVNVSQRMGQIATLVPMRMIGYFPGSRETESWLHQKFSANWHTGEWFRSSVELRQFIQMMGLLTAPPELPLREEAYKAPRNGEPNAAAVALAKRRMETMSSQKRQEVARLGGKASRGKLTPEQRSESARKAGLAGGRGRKKK
jgi:hypothetical protein